MGYQPRIRSPKRANDEFKKPFREKKKNKKRFNRRIGRPITREKHAETEQEVSEITLKRLHTLGNQRFGSSPFSEHFDRWLTNVTAVLSEFESKPNMNVDDEFVKERTETLLTIMHQLESRRRKEASINQEMRNLSDVQNHLKQINSDYAGATKTIKCRKNKETKRLYSCLNHLKKDQDNLIRMKTGFFHCISRKEKEQKEIEINQKINDKQRELEFVILNYNTEQNRLREEYERKIEPVLNQKKFFQKRIEELDDDGSLEERWFACEVLLDALNTFLQRKASQSHNSLEADTS